MWSVGQIVNGRREQYVGPPRGVWKLGHPRKRGEDDIVEYCRKELGHARWIICAQDRGYWQSLEENFTGE